MKKIDKIRKIRGEIADKKFIISTCIRELCEYKEAIKYKGDGFKFTKAFISFVLSKPHHIRVEQLVSKKRLFLLHDSPIIYNIKVEDIIHWREIIKQSRNFLLKTLKEQRNLLKNKNMCSSCLAEVQEGAKYCSECGGRIHNL